MALCCRLERQTMSVFQGDTHTASTALPTARSTPAAAVATASAYASGAAATVFSFGSP